MLVMYVNERDAANRTPLMNAAYLGNAEIIRLLLRYKANMNAVDSYGLTAEDIAHKYMHVL
jgi:ankyrin repeat protein